MAIVDEDVARVRQGSDIVAVISEHVALKRVGQRWQGLCPFHAERSASFSVNQAEGLYYCFGCQARGDVITFVREIEHLDFVAAVEKLAGKAGVALRYTDRGETEGRKRKARLLDAMAQAVEWYHERLLGAPDAASARGYLRSRGLDGDDVRRYKLGWAPEGWDSLAKALRLPDPIFIDSGLGFLNRSGRQTDAFRGRLLFPIFDAQGRPVAFGGRVLPGGEGHKYKNSITSAIYDKGKVLYGLNWAKTDVVAADEAVVCEGYTDVIAFAKAGLPRAVATCGTALTEDHVRLLRSFAGRVVLAFDADAAGQGAADRFYAWERKHGIDVAVASMPAGVDPAELGRTDPEALQAAVAEAVPFLRFRVERVLARADLSTAEGRARGAEAAMAVVAEHPSELVRDQYLMDVADRCRLDADRLRASAARSPGKLVQVAPSVQRGAESRREGAAGGAEAELLRLLIHKPEEMSGWEPWLVDQLFGDDLTLSAFRALRSAGSVREAAEAVDPRAADLLARLAADESDADPVDVIVLLVRSAARRARQEVDAELRRDPARAEELALRSTWLGLRLDALNDPATSVDAAAELVGSLSGEAVV